MTKLQMGPAVELAVKQLEEQGIPLKQRPKYDVPELPRDVTSLDEVSLMERFTQFTEWMSYMGIQLAAAEVDEVHAEKRVERLSARAINGSSAKTVAAAKAQKYDDAAYVDAEEENFRAHAFRKMVESYFKAAENGFRLISREITRRGGGRGDAENRGNRWRP